MGNKPKDRLDRNPITDEQFESVCELLETESGSIPKHCKTVGIAPKSFYKMLTSNEKYGKRYARSKDNQKFPMFEEIITISEEPVPMGEHGYDSAAVADKRLRIDARKWVISKIDPKKYGDKVDLTSDGERLQAPPTEIVYRVVK
jgi:hypothetical protein